MLQVQSEEYKIEEYLRGLGYAYIEKQVKAGPYRIDMVAYSINRGTLQPSVVVEVEMTNKDVVQAQKQLYRYSNYLESGCDALLVTNKGLVWFDMKTGLPKEKPTKKKTTTFIENEEDIIKILEETYRYLPNNLSPEQKLELIQFVLLARNYLFGHSKETEEFITIWDKMSKDFWTKVITLIQEEYPLFQITLDAYIDWANLEVVFRQVSFVHPQTPSLGGAFIEFKQKVSKQYYPPYTKELIEGILENLLTKRRKKESYLFWNYDTVYIPSKPLNNKLFTVIPNEKNTSFITFLAIISGFKESYNFISLDNLINKDQFHYCILDTISPAFSKSEFSKAIEFAKSHIENEGYLLSLIPESYFNDMDSSLRRVYEGDTDLQIRGIINLPEHIYRPISRVRCRLLILQKSNKVNMGAYFNKEIHSLEKDIPKTLKLFKKWLNKETKAETAYTNESRDKMFYVNDDMFTYDENIIPLENIVSINPESIKVEPKQIYRYIDIQSIDKQGRIASCKTLKGEQIPSRSKYVVREGDIILSLLRPGGSQNYNYVGYVSKEYDGSLTNSNLCVIRPKKINSKLLYLYFRNSYFSNKLSSLSIGNIPRINISSIKKLPIKKQISVQTVEIAQTLFTESMSILENTYEKLLESIFGNLLNKNASTVYEQYYLGHITDIFLGTKESFPETYQYEEIIRDNLDCYKPYIRSKNINIDELMLEQESLEWISKDVLALKKNTAKPGDILLDKKAGLLKKCNIAKFEEIDIQEFVPNQHIYIIRLNNNMEIDNIYLLAYLKSTYAQAQIGNDNKGLSMKEIRNLIVPIPKKEIQLEIVEELRLFFKKKKLIEKKLNDYCMEI